MRATGDKLEERFIIPIARELAEGLRAIHEAGIIHRDVKGEQSIHCVQIDDVYRNEDLVAIEGEDR